MADFETVCAHRLFQFCFSLFANMRAQLALHNGLEKSRYFALLAIDPEFDPAIREIADPPGNVEAFGNVPDGPSETDPLNAPFMKYLK
jgi:hypothetical protein